MSAQQTGRGVIRVGTFEFDLIVSGFDLDAHADALDELEAKVGDLSFAMLAGTATVAVERAARSLGHAVQSAIADVERLPGVRVERVLPDGHVSQAEIAARIGRTRQSVSQLVQGARGPGGFPEPAFGTGRTALWRWSEVAAWLAAARLIDAEDFQRQAVFDAANAMLDARRAVSGLSGDDQVALRSLVA
jgi:hypothetical protein